MELKFEQSDKECCTDTAGLYFVGKALNKNTSLRQELKKIKKRHGISNMDLIRSYTSLLVLGKHHILMLLGARNNQFNIYPYLLPLTTFIFFTGTKLMHSNTVGNSSGIYYAPVDSSPGADYSFATGTQAFIVYDRNVEAFMQQMNETLYSIRAQLAVLNVPPEQLTSIRQRIAERTAQIMEVRPQIRETGLNTCNFNATSAVDHGDECSSVTGRINRTDLNHQAHMMPARSFYPDNLQFFNSTQMPCLQPRQMPPTPPNTQEFVRDEPPLHPTSPYQQQTGRNTSLNPTNHRTPPMPQNTAPGTEPSFFGRNVSRFVNELILEPILHGTRGPRSTPWQNSMQTDPGQGYSTRTLTGIDKLLKSIPTDDHPPFQTIKDLLVIRENPMQSINKKHLAEQWVTRTEEADQILNGISMSPNYLKGVEASDFVDKPTGDQAIRFLKTLLKHKDHKPNIQMLAYLYMRDFLMIVEPPLTPPTRSHHSPEPSSPPEDTERLKQICDRPVNVGDDRNIPDINLLSISEENNSSTEHERDCRKKANYPTNRHPCEGGDQRPAMVLPPWRP